jgi:hypothetical protein
MKISLTAGRFARRVGCQRSGEHDSTDRVPAMIVREILVLAPPPGAPRASPQKHPGTTRRSTRPPGRARSAARSRRTSCSAVQNTTRSSRSKSASTVALPSRRSGSAPPTSTLLPRTPTHSRRGRGIKQLECDEPTANDQLSRPPRGSTRRASTSSNTHGNRQPIRRQAGAPGTTMTLLAALSPRGSTSVP